MPGPNRTHLSDLRGATRMAFDATAGITGIVEKMHRTIQMRPLPFGRAPADSTRGVTGFVYRSISGGMGISVHCAEDAPFIDSLQAEQAVEGTYYGDLQIKQFALACAVWPRGDIPTDFKQPVQSDVPVLFCSDRPLGIRALRESLSWRRGP